MNDITELAQSMKAATEKWQEACGKYDKVEITVSKFIRAANQYESIAKDPANIIALVEALEKAQQQIQTHERAELTWMNALELPDDSTRNDILPAIHAEKYMLGTANKRIADLEDAEQKLCAANVTLDARAELAERQLAELESRTVKLPELCVGVVQGGHAVMVPYAAGHWFNKTAILEMLAAAGIKVEVE